MTTLNAEKIDDVGEAIGRGARKAASRSSGEIRDLLADVEDLLSRVTGVDDADLARARERVEASLGRARESVVDGTLHLRDRAAASAKAADGYAHDSPWTLVGVAAVAGIALGAALARR